MPNLIAAHHAAEAFIRRSAGKMAPRPPAFQGFGSATTRVITDYQP